MLDALLGLLLRVGLAAPAVDLRPAGQSRLDAVTGEIAVNRLVIAARFRLGVDGVRARPDQRQIALEHDVEKLRQLVKARLADDAPDPGNAAVVLADQLRR